MVQAHMARNVLWSMLLVLLCVCAPAMGSVSVLSRQAGLVCARDEPCSFPTDVAGMARDPSAIDTSIHPDDWSWEEATSDGMTFNINLRLVTNGAEPPEQLVKVTDRRHRHPVFATMCSILFLATIIVLLIFCIS